MTYTITIFHNEMAMFKTAYENYCKTSITEYPAWTYVEFLKNNYPEVVGGWHNHDTLVYTIHFESEAHYHFFLLKQ